MKKLKKHRQPCIKAILYVENGYTTGCCPGNGGVKLCCPQN